MKKYKTYDEIETNGSYSDGFSAFPQGIGVIEEKYVSSENAGELEIEVKAGDWMVESEDGRAFKVSDAVMKEYYEEVEPDTKDLQKKRICPFNEEAGHEDITMKGVEKWVQPKLPRYFCRQYKRDTKYYIPFRAGDIAIRTDKNEIYVMDRAQYGKYVGSPVSDAKFNVCDSKDIKKHQLTVNVDKEE